jgi:small subunit ribosomal protein S15
MALKTDEKLKIIGKYKTAEKDTGSPQVQVALLSARIDELAEHLTVHKGDNHSRRGLLRLVGQRRKLFDYIDRTEGKKTGEKLRKDLKLTA